MKPFMEALPPEVNTKLKRVKPPEEQTLIQVATDFINDRLFGEEWLVATNQRLLFIPTDGADGTVEVPLEAVREAKIEELVDGGRLEVERKAGAPIYLHYSNSLSLKFVEVAEGIKQLSKGETLAFPTEIDRTRCETCGRLLSEKGGKCAACVKKLDMLWRILNYVRPYRLQLALVLLVTIVATLIDLLPPLITQHVIDDVLTPQSNFWTSGLVCAGLVGNLYTKPGSSRSFVWA